jgi:hypothetical protein
MSPDDLHTVTSPALVVTGDDDIVSLEHTVAPFRGLREAQLAVVQAASHLLLNGLPAVPSGAVPRIPWPDCRARARAGWSRRDR